jgi:hypothetical protein
MSKNDRPELPAFDLLRVYSIEEWAALSGISKRSCEELLATGEGPPLVRLTPKRRGIRAIDLANWQLARLLPRPRKRAAASASA